MIEKCGKNALPIGLLVSAESSGEEAEMFCFGDVIFQTFLVAKYLDSLSTVELSEAVSEIIPNVSHYDLLPNVCEALLKA